MTIPSRTPSFPEVLGLAVRNGLAEVHTNMPAKVVSYDEATQLIDAQPLVQQRVQEEDGSISLVDYPVLRSVPVKFPGANGFRITFPLVKDDEVELNFAECSLEVWKANGGIVDPKDSRRFHISDATATVGLHSKKTPWTGASKDSMTLGRDGGPQVVIRKDQIELGSDDADAPTDFVALASLVKAELKAIRDTLDAHVNTYNGHTHELGAVTVTGLKGVGTGTVVISGTIGLVPTGVPSGSVSSQANGPDPVGDVKSANVLAKSPP